MSIETNSTQAENVITSTMVDERFLVAYLNQTVTEQNLAQVKTEFRRLLEQLKAHYILELIISLKDIPSTPELLEVLATLAQLYAMNKTRLINQGATAPMGDVVLVDLTQPVLETLIANQVATGLLGLTLTDMTLVDRTGLSLHLNLPQTTHSN